MNPQEIEQLRRRMEEVAALPHEAPDRQAVLRLVSQIEGTLEQEWLDLIREDERLRLGLARVNAPPELEQRLLAIPRQSRPRSRWLISRSRWLSAAAAIVVVVLAVGAVVVTRSHRLERTLDDIATLTMASHDSQPQLTVTSSDWDAVKATVNGALYFPVDRPTLDPSFKLIGGRVIKLAGASMMYTRWERGGKIYSLYQFCGKDFGLHAPLPRQVIDRKLTPKTRCNVTVWTEGHCDYAFVADEDPAPAHGSESL
jgi:hypothetical protein